MDKLFALIQKTPVAQKLAIVGVFLAMVGVGYYFLVYQGQADEVKRLSNQLVGLENELQEKLEIANNITRFKKKVELLQQRLEEKKKNLPDDANMDQLLKTLNELSEKSDIRIIRFTPQPDVVQAFYAEIPVKMEIEGNYHEIATFFDKVAKEDRIINITDIAMADPQLRNGKVVVKGSCLAKTFRTLPATQQPQPGQPGQPAPPPAGGAAGPH